MKNTKPKAKRSLFKELVQGFEEIKQHREGKLDLRSHSVRPLALPT